MIILARHGQTTANADGLLLGRADPPLTDIGGRQAESIRLALAGLDVVRVVSSPLQRAVATASTIACGRPVEVDERWIELDYGEYDGRPVGDVPADVWQTWRADPHYVPPGGESLVTLGVRVRSACEELLDEVRERDVIVVSHVSPIKAALAWALAVGDDVGWRMFVQVASIARVTVGPWGPNLFSFNEVVAVS